MEKVNTGLKLLLRLFLIFVGVSILLGRIQIQEYQIVDFNLDRELDQLRRLPSQEQVGTLELAKQTNYRVVLKF